MHAVHIALLDVSGTTGWFVCLFKHKVLLSDIPIFRLRSADIQCQENHLEGRRASCAAYVQHMCERFQRGLNLQ